MNNLSKLGSHIEEGIIDKEDVRAMHMYGLIGYSIVGAITFGLGYLAHKVKSN